MIVDSNEGVYSMALMLLYVLKDNDKFSDIAPLALMLDRDNFDKLIDYYGGMDIHIPTRDEVNSALKSLVYYQSKYLDGKSILESRKLSGVSTEELRQVNRKASAIRDYFDSINEDVFKNVESK